MECRAADLMLRERQAEKAEAARAVGRLGTPGDVVQETSHAGSLLQVFFFSGTSNDEDLKDKERLVSVEPRQGAVIFRPRCRDAGDRILPSRSPE